MDCSWEPSDEEKEIAKNNMRAIIQLAIDVANRYKEEKMRLLDYLNPLWNYLGCRRFVCGLRGHPYGKTYYLGKDNDVRCNGCGGYLFDP